MIKHCDNSSDDIFDELYNSLDQTLEHLVKFLETNPHEHFDHASCDFQAAIRNGVKAYCQARVAEEIKHPREASDARRRIFEVFSPCDSERTFTVEKLSGGEMILNLLTIAENQMLAQVINNAVLERKIDRFLAESAPPPDGQLPEYVI